MATQKAKRSRVRIIGRTCVAGLALSGCSRDSLDLTRNDEQSRSAAVERAADAIARSREELIAQEMKSKSVLQASARNSEWVVPQTAIPEETPAENTSRWSRLMAKLRHPRIPSFKLRRHKDEESIGDPFLAASNEAKNSAEAKKPSPESRKPVTGVAKNPALDNAIDELLKENVPASVNDHKIASKSPKRDPLADKLASKRRTEQRVAQIPSTDPTEGKTIPVAATNPQREDSSEARPFPTRDTLETLANREPAEKIARPKSPFHREPEAVAEETPETERLAESHVRSHHPLADAEPSRSRDREALPRQMSPVSAKIAGLLAESHEAADRGDSSQALSIAIEAQRVATVHKHVFSPDEERPSDLVARLSERTEESSFDVAREPAVEDDRQISFSNGFSSESPRRTAERAEFHPTTSSTPQRRQPQTSWPEQTEFVDSNDLWKPQDAGATDTAPASEVKIGAQSRRRTPELIQATAGETFAPVEHAEAREVARLPELPVPTAIQSSEPSLPPLIELGQPTTTAPEPFQSLALADAPSLGSGPPLAPPPLAIGDDFSDAELQFADDAVENTASKGGRLFWFLGLGAIAGFGLVLFRRRTYGKQSS
jgi:hypothetical protein